MKLEPKQLLQVDLAQIEERVLHESGALPSLLDQIIDATPTAPHYRLELSERTNHLIWVLCWCGQSNCPYSFLIDEEGNVWASGDRTTGERWFFDGKDGRVDRDKAQVHMVEQYGLTYRLDALASPRDTHEW